MRQYAERGHARRLPNDPPNSIACLLLIQQTDWRQLADRFLTPPGASGAFVRIDAP